MWKLGFPCVKTLVAIPFCITVCFIVYFQFLSSNIYKEKWTIRYETSHDNTNSDILRSHEVEVDIQKQNLIYNPILRKDVEDKDNLTIIYEQSHDNNKNDILKFQEVEVDIQKQNVIYNSILKKGVETWKRNISLKRSLFHSSFIPHNNITTPPNVNRHTTLQPIVYLNGSNDIDTRNDTCESCFKNKFRVITNQNICNKNNITLLILVVTSVGDFSLRNITRQTWANVQSLQTYDVTYAFFVGKTDNHTLNAQIRDESNQFKDIIQFDFIDTYRNLTYKTLSMLNWAHSFCSQAQFVMKTDSDVFINTPLLKKILSYAPISNFQGGYCWGISEPHRELTSKWFVSYREYRKQTFPPMCSGTGYVMSHDVITGIIEVSKNIPFFYLEDVYIALCMTVLKIVPVLLDGFNHMLAQPVDNCHYYNQVVTSHYMNMTSRFNMWNDMFKCNSTEYTSISYAATVV